MPYGPGGTFTAISLPGSWNPATATSEATPDAWNLLLADLTGGLTNAITKNGLTTPTANLPMGSYKHTNVAAATANTDYARYDQLLASVGLGYGTAGGTGDAITLTLTPVITAYAVGRVYRAIAPGTNTGPVTVNIDGIGAGPLRWADGTELAPGDLPTGAGFTFMVKDITTPTAPIFHMQSVPTPHTGSAGPDLASAATVSIGASVGTYQNITGTTTITSFGAGRLGTERQVTFTGILTLTHNGTSLILPGAANITTAAGDTARFVSLGGSNWKCEVYTPASGLPLSYAALTNSLGANVSLNNAASYFDGPKVTGVVATKSYWVSGTVTLGDTTAGNRLNAKLWDGTSAPVASAQTYATTTGTGITTISLSGLIVNPVGDIRISVNSPDSTAAVMYFNASGNSKDSTITALRLT